MTPMLTSTHLKAMGHQSPADGVGPDATIEDLPTDVIALVLRRLDGASLAAAGCASSSLRALAGDPAAWRGLCLATWPSLANVSCGGGGYRALFADAFPFPAEPSPSCVSSSLPSRLISAVDIHHKDVPVLSCAVDTDTSSAWFLGSPFRIDALDQEGVSAPSPITPAELTLSWILIDPETGRAVNVSSRRPVAVNRKWLTGETVARFALVLGAVAVEAEVTCEERYGHIREVSLCVEDGDCAGVSGRDGLAAVTAAMAGARRGGGEEAGRRGYEEFVKGKRRRKERKARREGLVDLCCSGVGAAAFLVFLVMLAFR